MTETFGRYRLIDLLGRGGMGEVWRAYDTGTDRVVALKLLPAHFAQDPTFEQRFRREAHAAAGLHNAHIVPIHDFGEIDGRLYVDMALIEGHDLATEISNAPLAPERAVSIVEQIARALTAAHKTGLVHRDVKPSNILIGDDDAAYLIDFGIARAASDTGLTGTGNTLGTWAYMAPERFTTDTIDPRSDTYALTCVLYESLTGTKPFPGDTLERQFAGHLNAPAPKPSAVRADLPAGLDHVIAIGMAKHPENRYPTTKELADAARDALSGAASARTRAAARPVAAQHVAAEPAKPSRRKSLLIGGAVLVAAAATAAFVAIPKDGSTPEPAATAPSSTAERSYGEQITLPFADLSYPESVAVSTDGSVYVADTENSRILRLDSAADAAVDAPFTGLDRPKGLTVDAQNNVYVADSYNNRVLKLDAGSTTPVELPFNLEDMDFATGIAVDAQDNVFVTDSYHHQLLVLPAGADQPLKLDQQTLGLPCDVTVSPDGQLYIANSGRNQIVKFEPDRGELVEVPFIRLNSPGGVAVDSAGSVYATDDFGRVVKLDAGSGTQTELPFTGLSEPDGIAVDKDGNVYVADAGNNRIVKLPVA